MNERFLGHVKEIWRYPVSSLGGEQLDATNLLPDGVSGDRKWCLVDTASGRPAAPETDQKWRPALFLQSRLIEDDVEIGFPDAVWVPIQDPDIPNRLASYFGFPVEARAYGSRVGHASNTPVANRYEPSPVHVVTTASLQHLSSLTSSDGISARRFRPTIVLQTDVEPGFIESAWIGSDLIVGSVTLRATEETKRCGMTLIAQPNIDENAEVLRTIVRQNHRNFGIYCSVKTSGRLIIGDRLSIRA